MTQVQRITRDEFVALMGGLKGATILSLSWVASDPARFKADKGRITKVSHFSGMVNAHYDKKKAKSLGIPLEEVEVKPTDWKARLSGCVMQHKKAGTLYIEFYPQSGSSEYTLDGTPCERGDVADLLKKSSGGGVAYRLVKVDGIKAAQIGGVKYEIA